MYPGTQAFMRWELPSRLPAAVQQRALGVDPHAMAVALAVGDDPAAASFVYRAFAANGVPPMPTPAQSAAWQREFADGLLFTFPKRGHALERDFKWLGSHRYGIVHLGARDEREPRERCRAASARLRWLLPYVEPGTGPTADRVVEAATGASGWTARSEALPAK